MRNRTRDNSDQPTCSRYSVLHVREGGKWLMAVLREWPDEGVSLRDLDWLIGTWEAKTDDAEVRTTYEWDAKKNSIRCQITIKGKGRNVAAHADHAQGPAHRPAALVDRSTTTAASATAPGRATASAG